MVADMKLLSAAHRLEPEDAGVASAASPAVSVSISSAVPSSFPPPAAFPSAVLPSPPLLLGIVANCAKLCENLCISPRTTFSFRFNAPGRLRKLRCRVLPACAASSPSPSFNSSRSISPSASPSDSSVATSFLLGRRRFRAVRLPPVRGADLEIREMKADRLICRLSRFESAKLSDTALSGRWSLRGRRGSLSRARALLRAVGRLASVGGLGAWDGVSFWFLFGVRRPKGRSLGEIPYLNVFASHR